MTKTEKDIDLLTRKLANNLNYPWQSHNNQVDAWRDELVEKTQRVLTQKGTYGSKSYYILLLECIRVIPYMKNTQMRDIDQSIIADTMLSLYYLSEYNNGIMFKKLTGKDIEKVMEDGANIIKNYQTILELTTAKGFVKDNVTRMATLVTKLFVTGDFWKQAFIGLLKERNIIEG